MKDQQKEHQQEQYADIKKMADKAGMSVDKFKQVKRQLMAKLK